MADAKLTALDALTTPAGADLLYIIDDAAGTPTGKKVTVANFLGAIATPVKTSQNGAASTPPLLIDGTWFTGGSATTTKPQVLVEPSGATSTAWSTAGTGVGVNAPSGFTGNLLDLQLNGAARLKVDSAGIATLTGAGGSLILGQSSGTPSIYNNGGGLGLGISGNIYIGSSRMSLNSATSLEWGSTTSAGQSIDLIVTRSAANTLAKRNGTNAQTDETYGTYTDGSNYVRGAVKATSTLVSVVAETAGTGADDVDIALTPAGAGVVRIGTHSAVGSETISGFITIKDSGGTTRKLAVIS